MSAKETISFRVINTDLAKATSDALVIAVAKSADGPVILDTPLSPATLTSLKASLSALGVTGAADQIVRLPGLPDTGAKILVLAGAGTGKGATFSEEARRRHA